MSVQGHDAGSLVEELAPTRADLDALESGFPFGSYVIHSCIGRGAMARVYRAEHSALHKPVALKVMERALLERPDVSRRFLREGQAAAAVKHPNVVDITDVGVWHELPYLVMELLLGEDLESHLRSHGRLSEPELARLLLPSIAGLAAAHDSGVVHRDLKPSNIFLSRGLDGEIVPKLLDFGISKLSGLDDIDPTVTPTGELMGSPMYMSPEAMRGARGLTAKSDQYSLGVILYECVAGRAPFDSDSLFPLLEAVAAGNFKPPHEYRPELSRPLERAILRAMSLEPEDRFDDVRQLGQALWQAAEGRTRLLWSPSFGTREVTLAGYARQPLSVPTPSTPALVTHVGPSYAPEELVRSLRPPRRRMLAGLALGAFIVASLFVRLGAQPPVDRVAMPAAPAEPARALVASAAYQPALDEATLEEPDPSGGVAVPTPSREAADRVPTATPAPASSASLTPPRATSEKGSKRDATKERRSSSTSTSASASAASPASSGTAQRPAARSTRATPTSAPRARIEALPTPLPAQTSIAPYFGVNDAPILD